jgi:hypothetical protein
MALSCAGAEELLGAAGFAKTEDQLEVGTGWGLLEPGFRNSILKSYWRIWHGLKMRVFLECWRICNQCYCWLDIFMYAHGQVGPATRGHRGRCPPTPRQKRWRWALGVKRLGCTRFFAWSHPTCGDAILTQPIICFQVLPQGGLTP